ncbi:type IV secretory system conjugative DNA transfer family protein [Flavipsychrobacter stenotrophus]|uniref:type IV secretory system conjugative DNA transfer family protein n=1 Tax=Flavipsychrobacter stenotrophus TaxID=2077091 RepID=UPI001374C48E
MYIIGKSGTGKSTLLKNMAISDIDRGNGLCIIDPHGDIAADLVRYIPESRKHDLIYLNATDLERPIAFNPLKAVHPKYQDLVASGLISTFRKIWGDSWGPRLEYILKYTLLTLLCVPDATLLDIQPLLTDGDFRKNALRYVNEDHILNFWHNEFDKYTLRLRTEAIAPILNKTGLFVTSNALRKIVGQKTNGFRLSQVLDKGKILIVNVSKGQIGEDASSLIGAMLINAMQLAALYRASQPEVQRRPFYMYIDECHSFVTLSFATILAEARKYGLSLFLAHQYLEQMDVRVQAAIFGNVGTMISFRIGANDAEYLAKEFYPTFTQDDLVNLPRYAMYLKLMIDGTVSQPFSGVSVKRI